MKNIFLAIFMLTFSNFAQSKIDCAIEYESINYSDKIPPYLVGVWAPKDAKFNGRYVIKGFAIYLDSGGKGAAIDPYVGSIISAKYNAKNLKFQYITIESDGGKSFEVKGTYNPSSCMLTLNSEKASIVLYRRFSSIDSLLKIGLGIE